MCLPTCPHPLMWHSHCYLQGSSPAPEEDLIPLPAMDLNIPAPPPTLAMPVGLHPSDPQPATEGARARTVSITAVITRAPAKSGDITGSSIFSGNATSNPLALAHENGTLYAALSLVSLLAQATPVLPAAMAVLGALGVIQGAWSAMRAIRRGRRGYRSRCMSARLVSVS